MMKLNSKKLRSFHTAKRTISRTDRMGDTPVSHTPDKEVKI